MHDQGQVAAVTRQSDEWIEVKAEAGDLMGIPAPMKLRPGSTPSRVLATFRDDEIGREFEVDELRRGLEAIEGVHPASQVAI